MTGPSQPTVLEMRDADLPRLLAINEANVPEVGSVDEDRLRRLVELSAVALIVDVADMLAGFCLVLPLGTDYDSLNYRWFDDRHDDVMYVDRVAIDARFRRRGLGTLLYDEVERRVAQAGATGLTLEVNIDPPNPPSLAFHAGRGYLEVGRQATPYGIEVSMMHKDLGLAPPDPEIRTQVPAEREDPYAEREEAGDHRRS
ncbi:MAG: GNAT family N-acetyltransferase [Acidimicrobiia bacterium]|nr:GNAT family N-acetyltransferase [Acidimicrobiia bacterium]